MKMFVSNSRCFISLGKQFQKLALNTCTRSCSQVKQDDRAQPPSKKMSKAMKAYLERSRAYNEFIKKETDEYNIGKRHLANMMGMDAETFTEKDIDESIEYLFPSGLFEPKARPFLKPPHIIFPPKKDAEFDESGRPFHYLFYTGRPNFYHLMHEIVENMNTLNKTDDDVIKGRIPELKEEIELTGSKWLTKPDLEIKMMETITDTEYENFVTAMDRLVQMKHSIKVKDFIKKYRTALMEFIMSFEPSKPLYTNDGKAYVTTKDCPRKSARADVTVIHPGTGQISINGKNIEYFSTMQARNQLLFPLELTGMRTSVDIVATVKGGGETGQAGAIRWGISWGLRSFVTKDMLETMRIAGLLTRDYRRRERKKPGQAKARRKFTWKKR